MLAPLTSIVIEEIIKSPMDSKVPAPKKGQAIPAIKGFTPCISSLLGIVEPSLGFVQKGTFIVPAIRGFDHLILPKSIEGIFWTPSRKALEATLPSPNIINLRMFL